MLDVILFIRSRDIKEIGSKVHKYVHSLNYLTLHKPLFIRLYAIYVIMSFCNHDENISVTFNLKS